MHTEKHVLVKRQSVQMMLINTMVSPSEMVDSVNAFILADRRVITVKFLCVKYAKLCIMILSFLMFMCWK